MTRESGATEREQALQLRTQLAELRRELESERAARQASERALMDAIDSEQQRVAQLLHDTLSQSLNAVRIYARVTRDSVRRACPELSATFEELENAIGSTADEFHGVAAWLRPAKLHGSDLVACLTDLSRVASRSAPCDVRCDPSASNVATRVQAELLRVAQLGLHALLLSCRAQSVEMELSGDEERVRIQLRAACDRALPEGFETLLRLRARVMGGTVEVQHETERRITLTYWLLDPMLSAASIA